MVGTVLEVGIILGIVLEGGTAQVGTGLREGMCLVGTDNQVASILEQVDRNLAEEDILGVGTAIVGSQVLGHIPKEDTVGSLRKAADLESLQ